MLAEAEFQMDSLGAKGSARIESLGSGVQLISSARSVYLCLDGVAPLWIPLFCAGRVVELLELAFSSGATQTTRDGFRSLHGQYDHYDRIWRITCKYSLPSADGRPLCEDMRRYTVDAEGEVDIEEIDEFREEEIFIWLRIGSAVLVCLVAAWLVATALGR